MKTDTNIFNLNEIYLSAWNVLHFPEMRGMSYHAYYPPTLVFANTNYGKPAVLGTLYTARYWYQWTDRSDITRTDGVPVKTLLTLYPKRLASALNVGFGKTLPREAVAIAIVRVIIHELTHYDTNVKLYQKFLSDKISYSLYDSYSTSLGDLPDEIVTERDTLYRLRLYYDKEFDIKKYKYLGIEPGSPLDRRIMLKRIYNNPDHCNANELIMIWYYSVVYYSQLRHFGDPVSDYEELINQEAFKMAKALTKDPDARPYKFTGTTGDITEHGMGTLPKVGG